MSKFEKKGVEYLKYSGIAFQLLFIIGFITFFGLKIDAYLGLDTPYITVVLLLLILVGYFYKLYKELQ